MIQQLRYLIEKNKDKRILVLGTTCIGKTTLVEKIEGALDMDALVFPALSKKEKEYVCQSPWTVEIGNYMTQLVNQRIKVVKSRPLFGTVVLDSDFIIYLNINNKLLEERCQKRNVDFIDAKNMQNYIEKQIKISNINCIKYNID
ncbi:MAG: hypothetical protein Q7S27_05405 [Nanoarchaeota archaeon]|nr:hypothetical protein [Nanoarchaeota archaeon]